MSLELPLRHCAPAYSSHTLTTTSSLQRVYEGTLAGVACIVKERFSKQYRHPVLDHKLTARRTVLVSSSGQGRCLAVGARRSQWSRDRSVCRSDDDMVL